MSRFTTYAIKEITSSFLFLSILLTGMIWLGQGLRHIDLLTTNNVSVETYISYVVLLLPKIILLTFPICVFLAILFNLNRLRNDSELIILGATGKSEKNILIKPIMLFSFLMLFVVLFFSLYFTPNSLKELRYKIIEIRSSGIHISLLKEKKFVSPTNNFTIFLQEKRDNEIFGLLIHDQSNVKKPQTYIAEKGRFISSDNVNFLKLFNGSIQIYDSSVNRVSEIAFDTYNLDLTPYSKKENTHIYPDELSTSDIRNNIKNISPNNFSKYEMEQFAELHKRFVNPIYIIFYALLPLLMINFSKRPDDSWRYPIIAVCAIAFTIQIFQITFSNLLIDNSQLITLYYTFPLILIFVTTIYLYKDFLYLLRNQNV